MPPPANPSVEVLARELRRWKIFALVLLAALVGVGAFSAYVVRELDEDYSRLFDRTLPLMDELRVVGREEANAFRALVTGLVESEPAPVDHAVTDARESLERIRRLLDRLEKSGVLKERPELLRGIRVANGDYLAAAGDLLPRVAVGNTAQRERVSIENLRVALDRALTSNRVAIQFVESRSQAISDDYTRIVRNRATLLLGIAGLPVAFGTLIVVVVAFVVVAMIWTFRRVGAEDGA